MEQQADLYQPRIKQRKRRLRRRQVRRVLFFISFVTMLGFTNYFVVETGEGNIANQAMLASFQPKPAPGPILFANVQGTRLSLAFPADADNVIAAGFHESDRSNAIPMRPVNPFFMKESTTTVRQAIISQTKPVLFVMNTRGRASSPTSAVDIALKPGTWVKSPANGVIGTTKQYYLYGKYLDNHVEIIPDGFPNLRVVIIHVDQVVVKPGDRVTQGESRIGLLWRVPVKTQINRYLPKNEDHIHLQMNPAK